MSGQLVGRGYMTIVGLRDGDPASTYVLLPSVESVTKKLDGTLSVGEVYCSIYKVTGSSAYALSADHTLRYVRKPDGATDILEHANGVSSSIAVLSDTESIEFELSDHTNVIDRVRIPILSDATDVNDELGLYRYLREAIANGDTQFKGGLILSSLIRLGEWANADTDNPTMAKVWSGMNGLYKNGRTIANWWGGDMVDLFDENDNLIIPAPANAAAGLVRMDGSYYYSNGNIGGRADGSIWVGGQDGLKIDKNGHITLGSGIHIGTGDSADPTTLASILNFINNLTKLIVPVNEQKEELSWAHPDVADCYALKAKKGLYAMGFLSAHGLNADNGGGGAAYDRLDAWADYSTDREGWVLSALLGHDLHTRLEAIEGDYVKLSELPSLTGYATEQWVLGKGYITQDALTSYLTETDASSLYQPKGNYLTSHQTLHTLTLQLNGTEIGTFNPTANKTINIGDVASAAALASHTSNTTVHISATERAQWNKAASDLSTILGSDSDTVINKWEEVVAFFDTYTEADTLAGLLGNKVDKVAGYGLSKNDFNDTLLAKLNGIEAGANRYVLPTASATVKGGAMIGSGLMMASEVLSVNLNASHIPALDWSKITTGKPTTLGGYGITDAYTRAESNGLFAPKVAYSYEDGCLVRLKAPDNAATMVTILIEGNSYWMHTPIKSIVQFYNYPPSNDIINYGATHYGADFGDIKAFNYDGQICLWFIQDANYYTFAVTAICTANYNPVGNAVESITNAPMPTEGVTRLVTITPSKGLRTDNYASLLDSRYQQSANIHALTFTAGAFSAKTYDPKSAALTVNIPTTTDHVAEGGNLYFTNARAVSALSSTTNALQAAINTKLSEATFNAFKTAFDGMFELVNIGTDAAPLYAIHAKYGLYSDSFLSAHGLNDAGGNGGSSYSRLDAWNTYDSSKEGYVLSAKLGYDLYQNKADSAALNALASRVGTLEGKNYLDALTLNQNGSGNAVTSVALSADKRTLTVTKGATFLTEHQDISGLLSKTEAESLYQPKGNYFRQGLGSLTTEVAFDIRSCQTNDIYGYNPYNFDEPYGTIVTFNDGHYGFGGQFYLPRLASSHISYRGRNDNTPNWSAWHKLAFTSDIPSLSGYATESWVLGKNYLTAITKAMVENVLTGNITSHTHSQYLTQHQSLAGYVTINTEQAISGNKNFTGIVRITDNSATHDINTLPQLYFSIPGWCYTKFVYSKDDKLHLLDGAADLTGAHRTFVAGAFVKHGGTASQFLKADGSVDSNSYALASALNNYLPLAGGTMANTNLVTNLNADLLDGKHLSDILGSNVASATKLADNASYTAWGRPFFADGKPQNVSGALSGITDITMSGELHFANTNFHEAFDDAISFLHGSMGAKILTAGLLISNLYSNYSKIPPYGAYVEGSIITDGLLSANGGISTSAITATEIHLGPITLKCDVDKGGLQVIGGGLYTDSYLSAHGPSPTTVDYEARIAALENKIVQLESRLNA